MRINRYVNGEKIKSMPHFVENEAIREAVAAADSRRRAMEEEA